MRFYVIEMYKPEVSTDISPKMKTNSEVCLYVLIFTDFLVDWLDEKTNKNQDFFFNWRKHRENS